MHNYLFIYLSAQHLFFYVFIYLQVLGTADLKSYCDRYGFSCSFPTTYTTTATTTTTSTITPKNTADGDLSEYALPWKEMRTMDNEEYATDMALDLLDRLLVYDHEHRLTARQALHHPYLRGYSRVAMSSIDAFNEKVHSMKDRGRASYVSRNNIKDKSTGS